MPDPPAVTQTLVQCPDQFDFSTPGDWPKWKRRFQRYRKASGLTAKTDEEQVDTLIYLMGDQADDVLLTLGLTEGDKTKLQKVLDAFEKYFIVRRNVIYERAKFNNRVQLESEPVE